MTLTKPVQNSVTLLLAALESGVGSQPLLCGRAKNSSLHGEAAESLSLSWGGRKETRIGLEEGEEQEGERQVGDGGVRASHLQLQQLPLPCGGARRCDLQRLPGKEDSCEDQRTDLKCLTANSRYALRL